MTVASETPATGSQLVQPLPPFRLNTPENMVDVGDEITYLAPFWVCLIWNGDGIIHLYPSLFILCVYIYITHYSWYSSWLLHTPSVYIQNAGFASFLFAWIPDGGRRSESIAAVFPGAVLKRATSLLFVRERSNQYYSTGMFSIVWFKCFHLYGMYDGRVRLL
jgi:hypothetical protein